MFLLLVRKSAQQTEENTESVAGAFPFPVSSREPSAEAPLGGGVTRAPHLPSRQRTLFNPQHQERSHLHQYTRLSFQNYLTCISLDLYNLSLHT